VTTSRCSRCVVVCEECGEEAVPDLDYDRWRCPKHGFLTSWEVFDHRGLYQTSGALDEASDPKAGLTKAAQRVRNAATLEEILKLKGQGVGRNEIRRRLRIGTTHLTRLSNGGS
jgi:hypothetical protein